MLTGTDRVRNEFWAQQLYTPASSGWIRANDKTDSADTERSVNTSPPGPCHQMSGDGIPSGAKHVNSAVVEYWPKK